MSPQKDKPVVFKGLIQAVAAISTVLILSALLESYSYLLFHSIVEIFSTVILWSIFVLAFNIRRFLKTSYFIFLGTGFLFVGIFDIFHTLAFKGMKVFPGSDSGNLSTQLWIAMRYLLAFSYLLALIFIRKKISFRPLFVIFTVVTALLLFTILWKPVFPVCYILGTGLTPFKINSEYIICIVLFAALWLLQKRRAEFHSDVFNYLVWSVSLTILSELCFAHYKNIFGLFNTLGHILEILAFLAAYKAVIEKGLNHPHDLIFFDMKRHEAALSESEQRYRSLFDSMTEGFALHEIICDDQGKPCDYRFLDVNPAFERMTGLKRSKVLGRTHNEVQPGDDPRWVAEYGAVALTGKPVRFQNYSSALKRHYDVSAYRSAPRQFAVVFTDITELKLAEEALRTSERLYRAIGESINYGIWVCDTQGRNTYASESFLKLVGITQEQCSDLGWGDVLHPDDVEATIAAWKECVQKGGPWYREHRFRGTDGQWHPVLACGVAVCDEQGKVTAWAGINLDISRIKRAEQTATDLAATVMAEKERLLALINSSPDEIWFADADGKFTLMNASASHAFSLEDRPELPVKRLAESLEVFRENGTPRPVEEAPPIRALRGEFVKGEVEIIRMPSTGKLQHRQVNAAPVYDAEKHIIGSISVVRDITELKKTEEMLRQNEARLQAALLAGRAFIFEWSPGTDEVYRSEHCGPILGLDPESCTRDTGRNFFEQIHPEDRAGFKKLVQTLTPAAPDYKTEYRYIQPNGQAVWLEERGLADFDKTGHVIRLHGITTDVTDRVEARRRESEALAAASAARSAAEIVNAMDEGVVLMELDGTILNMNPSALAFAELRWEDVSGKNVDDILQRLLTGEDLEMATAALAAIAQKQMPLLRTVTLKRPQGPPLYIIPAVTFIESPQGAATVVITLKDITELHENTAILERVFDNSHISIVYLDAQFNFIRVNSTYAADCGHPEDFFPGKNHFDIYPNEENERIFRQVVASGTPYAVYDKPFEFPDHPEWGISYWDWSLQPIKDEHGQVEALIFCLQNTTPRKTALLALEESERKYRELVENANSIIMRITPDHRITFFNEYAQSFFGYSFEEVLDKSVLETITPPIDSAGNDLRHMIENITVHPELYATNENENICKNGRRVWVSWTNKVIRDERGKISEILCVGTDATARKQIQTENQRYQERLRRLAEQLSSSEEQERWQISRYIHDTIVQNLSLSSIKLGGAQNSVINADLKQTAAALKTIQELIDEAINECRTAMSELTPPLLYELGLIPAFIELSNHLGKQHGVKITVEKNEQLDRLEPALRSLLFQSARELIMNALKHAKCRHIRISVIQTEAEFKVYVQDDGCGFDPSRIDHQKADHGGGFGLFSVRERAESLSGRLDFESRPGHGTKIGIAIPLRSDSTQKTR